MPIVQKITSLQYLRNISRKMSRMKLIFCLQINVKGFFKLILSLLVCVTRHPQITQNNKFSISLQYLIKEVSDEVDFSYAGKHESLLQIDTMMLMRMVKRSQSSQNSKFVMSFNISKKKLEMKLVFCMQMNIKAFY